MRVSLGESMKFVAALVLIMSFQTFAQDCIGICGYTATDLIINRDKVIKLLNEFKQANDHREIYNKDSEEFLETYGKLMISGVQKCTANIVSDDAAKDSTIVTTSEHCFKPGDEGKKITVEFTKRDGTIITRELKMITKNKENDYAILKLDRKILNSEIKPLEISEYGASDLIEEVEMIGEDAQVTFAGYSADNFKGAKGRNLTYDQKCEIVALGRGGSTSTNCIAYPGASGGAFVISYTDEDGHRRDMFTGVNKSISFNAYDKKSPHRASFVDHTVMYDDLMSALN